MFTLLKKHDNFMTIMLISITLCLASLAQEQANQEEKADKPSTPSEKVWYTDLCFSPDGKLLAVANSTGIERGEDQKDYKGYFVRNQGGIRRVWMTLDESYTQKLVDEAEDAVESQKIYIEKIKDDIKTNEELLDQGNQQIDSIDKDIKDSEKDLGQEKDDLLEKKEDFRYILLEIDYIVESLSKKVLAVLGNKLRVFEEQSRTIKEAGSILRSSKGKTNREIIEDKLKQENLSDVQRKVLEKRLKNFRKIKGIRNKFVDYEDTDSIKSESINKFYRMLDVIIDRANELNNELMKTSTYEYYGTVIQNFLDATEQGDKMLTEEDMKGYISMLRSNALNKKVEALIKEFDNFKSEIEYIISKNPDLEYTVKPFQNSMESVVRLISSIRSLEENTAISFKRINGVRKTIDRNELRKEKAEKYIGSLKKKLNRLETLLDREEINLDKAKEMLANARKTSKYIEVQVEDLKLQKERAKRKYSDYREDGDEGQDKTREDRTTSENLAESAMNWTEAKKGYQIAKEIHEMAKKNVESEKGSKRWSMRLLQWAKKDYQEAYNAKTYLLKEKKWLNEDIEGNEEEARIAENSLAEVFRTTNGLDERLEEINEIINQNKSFIDEMEKSLEKDRNELRDYLSEKESEELVDKEMIEIVARDYGIRFTITSGDFNEDIPRSFAINGVVIPKTEFSEQIRIMVEENGKQVEKQVRAFRDFSKIYLVSIADASVEEKTVNINKDRVSIDRGVQVEIDGAPKLIKHNNKEYVVFTKEIKKSPQDNKKTVRITFFELNAIKAQWTEGINTIEVEGRILDIPSISKEKPIARIKGESGTEFYIERYPGIISEIEGAKNQIKKREFEKYRIMAQKDRNYINIVGTPETLPITDIEGNEVLVKEYDSKADVFKEPARVRLPMVLSNGQTENVEFYAFIEKDKNVMYTDGTYRVVNQLSLIPINRKIEGDVKLKIGNEQIVITYDITEEESKEFVLPNGNKAYVRLVLCTEDTKVTASVAKARRQGILAISKALMERGIVTFTLQEAFKEDRLTMYVNNQKIVLDLRSGMVEGSIGEYTGNFFLQEVHGNMQVVFIPDKPITDSLKINDAIIEFEPKDGRATDITINGMDFKAKILSSMERQIKTAQDNIEKRRAEIERIRALLPEDMDGTNKNLIVIELNKKVDEDETILFRNKHIPGSGIPIDIILADGTRGKASIEHSYRLDENGDIVEKSQIIILPDNKILEDIQITETVTIPYNPQLDKKISVDELGEGVEAEIQYGYATTIEEAIKNEQRLSQEEKSAVQNKANTKYRLLTVLKDYNRIIKMEMGIEGEGIRLPSQFGDIVSVVDGEPLGNNLPMDGLNVGRVRYKHGDLDMSFLVLAERYDKDRAKVILVEEQDIIVDTQDYIEGQIDYKYKNTDITFSLDDQAKIVKYRGRDYIDIAVKDKAHEGGEVVNKVRTYLIEYDTLPSMHIGAEELID